MSRAKALIESEEKSNRLKTYVSASRGRTNERVIRSTMVMMSNARTRKIRTRRGGEKTGGRMPCQGRRTAISITRQTTRRIDTSTNISKATRLFFFFSVERQSSFFSLRLKRIHRHWNDRRPIAHLNRCVRRRGNAQVGKGSKIKGRRWTQATAGQSELNRTKLSSAQLASDRETRTGRLLVNADGLTPRVKRKY